MTLTGTVSDFDKDGLFGLIIADDGCLLLFNLRDTSPGLRDRFEIGTRVNFIKQASSLAARAVALVPIDAGGRNGR